MFPEQLKKILNLIKQTGDRMVIFDGSNPDANPYVIMDFDNYAGLRTDSSLSGKETKKSGEQPLLFSETAETSEKAAISQAESIKSPVSSERSENLTEEDLTDKINREISMWKNREDSAYLGEENKPKKAWQIPSQVKEKARDIE